MFGKLGSPPRVREKLVIHCPMGPACRITPASAGKTDMVISLLAEGRDHPRECGKNKLVRGIHSWIKGSPPRVREKPYACPNS